MTQAHLRGVDVEPAREQQLKSDRHIAEAHRAVTVVEQRAGDDSDRVGEIDDPGIRRGAAAHFVGDVEYDRNRAQRLGEASCTCGLLADATAPQRNGLIEVASGLTTDSQLQEHEVGAIESLAEIRRSGQGSLPSMAAGDPPTHSGDRIEAHRVGIAENELVHLDLVAQASDSIDQLGRVRAPATDHRDLHGHSSWRLRVRPVGEAQPSELRSHRLMPSDRSVLVLMRSPVRHEIDRR